MVNKLTIEVDTRYSAYAKCNICQNGTDGRGHACPDDTYFCYCSKDGYHEQPCQKTAGRENLYDYFGGGSSRHFECKWYSKPADCYKANAAQKLTSAMPGYWFSTLADGYCDGAGQGCTWRVVTVDKIVTRECHSAVFGETVAASAPTCFDGCGAQKTNTSSPCWVDCFYRAALGPDSGKAGGHVAGLSLQELVAAWEKPFLPEAQGGCPAKQEMPSWYVEQLQVEASA